MSKCCVCGYEGDMLQEFQCSLTNEILPYCMGCMASGFEPYDKLVDFGWDYEFFNNTYQLKVINPTLMRNGKTVEQFNNDVRKKRDDKYECEKQQ